MPRATPRTAARSPSRFAWRANARADRGGRTASGWSAMQCHAARTHANRAAASCAAREPLASITPPPALEP
ncbi:hypothetical protein BOC39_20325 [Burkholderia pseudomallei]|nr:hypothetical protein BOC37_16355 [Burkholderia pseudomallei]ARK75946.1 hypothetical protein BOC39_20325 [Burkholderia pseudomallei]ARL23411.1 hypothetical protein BOC47_14235 [Burkholderia pseudomallei]ARL29701.1 hypothetical protein BOC48_10005 [Burkholderia pseudomallei]ARL73929.1 hypothetical protein BOC54_17320 [Burkholderia pseudomallei]